MKSTVFNSRIFLVVLFSALIILTTSMLSACASEEPVITENMSEEDYFKSAQRASDRGNYKLALAYYYKYKEDYPDNLQKNAWASYEIAFLYHKMGDDTRALELFNEILTLFSQDRNSLLPKTIKELTLIIKEKIETKLQPQPTGEQ